MVPCVAAGGVKEYADFVKEGNFTPLTVMNPELGMETAIFAEDREHFLSEGTTASVSGRITGMSGEEGTSDKKEICNMDKVHAKVTEMLNSIDETTKSMSKSSKMIEKPVEKRYKGRRRKISVTDAIANLTSHEQGIVDTCAINSANSSRSSGYHSQQEINDSRGNIDDCSIVEKEENFDSNKGYEDKATKYDILAANLLDSMVEEKAKFRSSFRSGAEALDTFLDTMNPMNKTAHPALPAVVKDRLEENRKRGRYSLCMREEIYNDLRLRFDLFLL